MRSPSAGLRPPRPRWRPAPPAAEQGSQHRKPCSYHQPPSPLPCETYTNTRTCSFSCAQSPEALSCQQHVEMRLQERHVRPTPPFSPDSPPSTLPLYPLSFSLSLCLFLSFFLHHSTAVGRNCHNIHRHDDCTKTNCSLLSGQNKLHNCHKKQNLENCEGRHKWEGSAKQTIQQLTQNSFHDKDEKNCKSAHCPEEKSNYNCACLPHHWGHRGTSTSAPSVSAPQSPIDATIRRHSPPPATRGTSTSSAPFCRHTIDTIDAIETTKAHQPSTHGNPSGCSPSILSTRLELLDLSEPKFTIGVEIVNKRSHVSMVVVPQHIINRHILSVWCPEEPPKPPPPT